MPLDQVKGYQKLFSELDRYLCEITGIDKISFQPNRFYWNEDLQKILYLNFFINLKRSPRWICRPYDHNGIFQSTRRAQPKGKIARNRKAKLIKNFCFQICLIPTSSHGTNPASAAMAGMQIIKIKVDKEGKVDMNHLKEAAEKYKKDLACAMITYPSTHGVFDSSIA